MTCLICFDATDLFLYLFFPRETIPIFRHNSAGAGWDRFSVCFSLLVGRGLVVKGKQLRQPGAKHADTSGHLVAVNTAFFMVNNALCIFSMLDACIR